MDPASRVPDYRLDEVLRAVGRLAQKVEDLVPAKQDPQPRDQRPAENAQITGDTATKPPIESNTSETDRGEIQGQKRSRKGVFNLPPVSRFSIFIPSTLLIIHFAPNYVHRWATTLS